MQLKVLLVDDDDALLEVLARSLGEDRSLKIVGTASNGLEALRILDSSLIEVVVADIRMPGMDGSELLQHVPKWRNAPVFVAMTAHDQDQAMIDILRSGACGCIAKGEKIDDIRSSIHAAAKGGTSVSPIALTRLLQYFRRATERPNAPAVSGLDPTTRRVLDLVCNGLFNKRIADTLGVSVSSVKKHVWTLFAYFNVASRSELIVHMHRPAR